MGAPYGGIDPITGRTVGREPKMSYDDWLMWFLITHGDSKVDDENLAHDGYPSAATDIGHMNREIEMVENSKAFTVTYQLTDKGKRYLEMLENYDRVVDTSNERRV